MGTTAALMTVEEFQKLPEDPSVRRELQDGEVFAMTRPSYRHWDIQDRLVDLLKPLLRKHGRIGAEFAFRPEPDNQIWAADVAFVRAARLATIDPEDNLSGAPDLVIEVASPLNTALEFERRETMCMRTGCSEFWIVYPELELVKVTTVSQVKRYGRGGTIELTVAPGINVAVDSIFPKED